MIAAGIIDGRAWIVGYHPRYASQGFRVGAYAYAELVARTVADFGGGDWLIEQQHLDQERLVRRRRRSESQRHERAA